MAERWPVFLCYRQSDGKGCAERVYELLHGQRVPTPPEGTGEDEAAELDVYFDQAAPGVGDWTGVHEPYLKRARAMILVCTPGAKLVEGDSDWVHKEIRWWVENRSWAPILIDPLGADDRYVPEEVAARWPNAQRLEIIEREWEALSPERLQVIKDRTRARLMGGIAQGTETFYRDELERELTRARELHAALQAQERLSKRLSWLLAASIVLLVASVAAGVFAYTQQRLAESNQRNLRAAQERETAASLNLQLLRAEQLSSAGDHVAAGAVALRLLDQAGDLAANQVNVDLDRARVESVLISSLNGTSSPISCLGPAGPIRDMEISHDGRFVAASSANEAFIWRTDDCRLVRTLADHTDVVSHVAWHPLENRLLTVSWDRSAILHEVDAGAPGVRFDMQGARCDDVDFSRDGRWLFATSSTGGIDVWDVASAVKQPSPLGGGQHVSGAVVSKRGTYLLELTDGPEIRVWDLESGRVAVRVDRYRQPVLRGAFSGDEQQLVVALGDDSVRVLSLDGGAETAVLDRKLKYVTVVTFSPSGDRVLAASDGMLGIWDARSGVLVNLFDAHRDDVSWADFLSEQVAISGSDDGRVFVWDTQRPRIHLSVAGASFTRRLFAVSRDRAAAAIAADGEGVQMWPVFGTADAVDTLFCTDLLPRYRGLPRREPEILELLELRCGGEAGRAGSAHVETGPSAPGYAGEV